MGYSLVTVLNVNDITVGSTKYTTMDIDKAVSIEDNTSLGVELGVVLV